MVEVGANPEGELRNKFPSGNGGGLGMFSPGRLVGPGDDLAERPVALRMSSPSALPALARIRCRGVSAWAKSYWSRRRPLMIALSDAASPPAVAHELTVPGGALLSVNHAAGNG